MVINSLYEQNIFRKCVGDRTTTRNVLDIKQGQIILVRRGLMNEEMLSLVSFISLNTYLDNN